MFDNTKNKLIRSCPNCNKEIYYSCLKNRNRSDKEKKLCKTCCKLGVKNGRFNKGYILSGENHPNFGKHLSKETIEKIRKSNQRKIVPKEVGDKISKILKGKLAGSKNPMFGKNGILNPNYGNRYKLSDSTRNKMRISKIERIKKLHGYCFPNFNEKSCEYFKEIELKNNWNGHYATKNKEYFIENLGYFVDYYEPNLNIVIEYDEPRHYVYGNLKEKDINRMNEIKNHLKCRFLRFNEYTEELKEYSNMPDIPNCRFDLTFIILGIVNLSTIKPENFVEIGSRDGYDANFISNQFGINHKNCIIFEPNPESCQNIIKSYPGFNVFNNAVSSDASTKDFYIDIENIGACSLLKKIDSNQKSIKVECIDMESVIDNLKLISIDICKIDTEGTTLDVLKSFGNKINLVKSIQLESETAECWENQSLYIDVKKFLQNNNFVESLFCRLGETQIDSFWIHKNYIKYE